MNRNVGKKNEVTHVCPFFTFFFFLNRNKQQPTQTASTAAAVVWKKLLSRVQSVGIEGIRAPETGARLDRRRFFPSSAVRVSWYIRR